MYDYVRLIKNAKGARSRTGSEWGKKYWSTVIQKLLVNMREQETIH